MTLSSPAIKQPIVTICSHVESLGLAQQLQAALRGDRYELVYWQDRQDFCHYIDQAKEHIDCLVLQQSTVLEGLVNYLHNQATFLPAVILASKESSPHRHHPFYHEAEICLSTDHLDHLATEIDHAIASFLRLPPTAKTTAAQPQDSCQQPHIQESIVAQQRRLAEKLKERLGYLGIYYKRDPQQFLRHLPPDERQALLQKLRSDYRAIILNYFRRGTNINPQLDEFVNQIFFADISVSQVLEMHMELMDEFAKRLKLEGRNEDILLDYRLALIDVIAHLCEMYRRSIPRER